MKTYFNRINISDALTNIKRHAIAVFILMHGGKGQAHLNN